MMAAVLFQVPYTSVVVNGLPVPYAKLYFSTSLTTTPLATYTTAGLTVAHPNPVRSTASGRLPDIYLDNTKTYRLRIFDKGDSLLEDIDPFIPGTVPAAEALAPYQAAAESAAASAGTSAGTAATGADTSTTQAGIATSAATIATTQAGIATAAASSAVTSITSVPNATAHAADRTALALLGASSGPAFLREAGREATFVFDSSNLSAKVTADTAQGIYVAPASDTTGASGAWVRKFSGPINLGWFGLVEGDNSANGAANAAAVAALKATLAARKLSASGAYVGVEQFRIPYGTYWFGDSGTGAAFDFQDTVIIEGVSAGYSGSSPLLKFPVGVTGFRFQDTRSSGANTKDGSAHNGAQGSILRNVTLYGAFTTTEAEAHGVQARTVVRLTNVHCNNFEGDGFYFSASSGAASGATPPYGNVNCSTLLNCTANNNRRGLFLDGTDANAVNTFNFNANTNRWAGVYDSALIFNSYFGGQLATNGVVAANTGTTVPASYCSNGTYRYGVILGQESGASTNAPSGTATDNTWWYYVNTGAAAAGVPLWTSGLTWRAGGNVICDEIAGGSCFFGTYSEASGPKSQMVQGSMAIGGTLPSYLYQNAAANRTGIAITSVSNGVMLATNCIQVKTGTVTAQLGYTGGNPGNYILKAIEPTYSPLGNSLTFDSSTGDLVFGYAASPTTNNNYRITGLNTTTQFGTGAAVPHAFFTRRLFIGDTEANGRQIANGTAAPASGAHARGEIVFNRNMAVGSPIGWACTVAGTPGTWVAMANL